MYRNGTNGAPHSYEEAIKWYTKAADAGHIRAMCGLGVMYEKGLGVEKSPAEAMRLYLQSASKGWSNAYAYVGFMYEDGVGVPVSKPKALSYYLKAAQGGSVLGQCNLGRCYAHGIGCKQSGTEAVKWLLKAVEQNSGEACERLGFYYETGLYSVGKSETSALKYYRKGAELGNDNCRKKVAELTAAGKSEYDEYSRLVMASFTKNASVSSDREKERMLLKRSALKGYEPAQKTLAGVLMSEAEREGNEKKYAEAIVWFRKSAEQGNTESMKQLSCLYGMGKGCKKSPSESFYWAEKGSKAGDPVCQTLLSALYSLGEGCDKDEVKAFEFAREAAKAENYPDAWYALGLRYLKGEGTPTSVELGIHWLKKAAKMGHPEAEKLLRLLNDRLHGGGLR
jgi:TPR repeat protein